MAFPGDLSQPPPLHWLSASRSAAKGENRPGAQKRKARTVPRGRPASLWRDALPTRGSARRTIGYVARPPAAPSGDGACACTRIGAHPLCAEWRRSWRGAISRCALTPRCLPGAGSISHASCRPLPGGKGNGRHATRGWFCGRPPPRRPAALCANSPRAATRRSSCGRTNRPRLFFFGQSAAIFRPFSAVGIGTIRPALRTPPCTDCGCWPIALSDNW